MLDASLQKIVTYCFSGSADGMSDFWRQMSFGQEGDEMVLKARLIYTFVSSLEPRYNLMRIYVGITYSPVMK